MLSTSLYRGHIKLSNDAKIVEISLIDSEKIEKINWKGMW